MRRTPFFSRARRRGFALLLVLWVAIILTLLVYATLYHATSESNITSSRRKVQEAEALARAGVARAIVDLKNDMIFDAAEEGEAFDAEGDIWARSEEGKLDAELGRGTFTVQVTDRCGYIDITRLNAASKPMLQKIFEHVGYNEDDALEAATAVVDWIDLDEQSGAEEAVEREGRYYARLIAEAYGERVAEDDDLRPVKIPNEPFQTVDQLLDVYGVTPEAFFGPGTPEAEFFADAAPNTPRDGKKFEIENEPRRRRGEAPLGLRDFFVAGACGALNVNTAPDHVLAAYFEGGGATDGERAAESVVRKRRGGRANDIDNRNAYRTMALVQEDGDLAPLLAASTAIYPYDIRSSSFLIRSTGMYGDTRKTVEVQVAREMLTLLRDESFEVAERAEERAERLKRKSERRTSKDLETQVSYPSVTIVAWNE